MIFNDPIVAALGPPAWTPYVFTTTKQAQSWQLTLTAGATYHFDWGDGTGIDSFVGNGALQTVAHNYAAPGTYQIKCRIDNPLALTDFRCNSNELSGPLPSFAACTNLVTFYCHTNSFSGTLPSFAACVKLVTFYCATNSFSGTLPSFAACTDLVTFYCFTNSFSGTLPSFAACVKLVNFSCHTNSFSGTLPTFAACVKLVDFSCHTNSFSGTLPSFAACTNLVNFYCFTNSFSGTLPSFAACVKLVDFRCHTNAFSDYAPGVMPTPCNSWRGEASQFPQTAVDAILADFESNIAARPATGAINVGGAGNAALGAAGLASKAAIQTEKGALNWPITHN